jgi:hypothetical protein
VAQGRDALTSQATPRERYAAAEEKARSDAVELERRLLRASRLRIVTFLVAAGPFLLLETAPPGVRLPLVVIGSIAGLVFLALVRGYVKTRRRLGRARLRETVAREGQARLSRRWEDLPPPPFSRSRAEHPSADDLDLVDRASLAHLIGRVSTAPGKAILEQLILDPFRALPEDGAAILAGIRSGPSAPVPAPQPGWREALTERQEAVDALAGEAAFREEVELLGREAPRGGVSSNTAVFLEWLARPGWLAEHRMLLIAARALALFTPLTLTTWLFGLTPGLLPVLGALAAVAVHRVVAPHASERLSAAEAGEGDLLTWSAQLDLIGRLASDAALIARAREAVLHPTPGARRALRKLQRITDTAGVRRSSLAHFPLVVLFAWDVHMLDWLERWHARHAAAAGRWIRVLGEMEALAALGGLRADHPDWTFPEIIRYEAPGADASPAESIPAIRAKALGHPLIDPDRCVRNDVEVPGPGRLLLVTGSNMAGKTTLLRALGVNQCLALAGGPVAAERLETPALLPWCAMRVRDSLESGVSYFLAELQRLRSVVDAARATPSLFLLDEILQGTNSAERRIAAQIVLGELLRTESVGAVTTHDLGLASTPELADGAVNVHFREDVATVDGKHALHFDYKLRPGPATSRNALLLLEIVGLAPSGAGASPSAPTNDDLA